MFFRVLSKIFSLYLFRLGEAVLVGVFKKVLFPKEQPARKFEMCGFQGIIFSSLIPTERGRLGSHSQKNFLPSKSRQREASFFTPVLNIPSLVPTGSGQKLCLFCNFLPSRGRSRERLKIKPFEKIFFFPQQVGNEDNQKPRLCRKKFSFSSGRARKRRFYEWF